MSRQCAQRHVIDDRRDVNIFIEPGGLGFRAVWQPEQYVVDFADRIEVPVVRIRLVEVRVDVETAIFSLEEFVISKTVEFAICSVVQFLEPEDTVELTVVFNSQVERLDLRGRLFVEDLPGNVGGSKSKV